MKRILLGLLIVLAFLNANSKEAMTAKVETLPLQKFSTYSWVTVRNITTFPVSSYKEIVFGSSRPNENNVVALPTGFTINVLKRYLKQLIDVELTSVPSNSTTVSYFTDEGYKLIEASFSTSTKKWTVKLYINEKLPDSLTKEQVSNLLQIIEDLSL